MRVLITGGGIGGLTAALCLAKHGHEISVFEQAPIFAEIGAGIQLSPNATRILHGLNLQAALAACGFIPAATQFRHWKSGRVIAENPLGAAVEARYGAPYYHIHRGDLLRVLWQAATEHPAITLHPDARVTAISQTPESVEVRLQNSSRRGDMLIGADGIHSVIRRCLWGDEQPVFTGNVAWRAMVRADTLPPGLIQPVGTVWWGPQKHFVHYFVKGGAYINCVCVVEKSGWTVESWTEPGTYAELKADFAGWHDDVQALIDHAEPESLFKWALFDRPPMPQWGIGRVTLLGDACHPTLPFMAQGAAMAIEDSAVLARCVTRSEADRQPVAEGLQRYEALRRQRTAAIQRGSRRNAKVFHLRGIAAWARNRAAARAGSRSMHALYSYDAQHAAED